MAVILSRQNRKHITYAHKYYIFFGYFTLDTSADVQNGNNQVDGDAGGTCRCSGLDKNDERLEIKHPEIYDGDLTAIVHLKSFSRKFISRRLCFIFQ